MFQACKAFYQPEKQDKSLTTYFMEFMKTYKELNMLLSFNADMKAQQTWRERMVVTVF